MRHPFPSTREAICTISSAKICRYSSKSDGFPSSTVTTRPEVKKLTLRRYFPAKESTEATKDGKVKGVYSYTPDKIDQYRKAGSYNVSGTIDMSSLIINLTEDNNKNVFTDISAILYIEKSKIKGVGQKGYPIDLTKVE